jgi:small neutral amino acid transporter SnatA (MarC family)
VLLVTAALAFGVGAPPERCPSITAAELEEAAAETVAWFGRNQEADGRWLYSYHAGRDVVFPDYNVVRHAGVTMGLYMAAAADIPGALESADRGLAWAEDHLLSTDDWDALTYQGQTSTGATALLVAGLVDRRLHTGDRSYDRQLQRLGRFLVTQTEQSGAVLAYYSTVSDAPMPDVYSKYYTGETYWALARLHRLFPTGAWDETADRIGDYLATRRDEVEDHWPEVPDHWAAYGQAETVNYDERTGDRPLTEGELAYAERQAGSFGAQVRWVSQRSGPWGALVRGAYIPRGGGYGVVGEALTGWWRVAGADARLADLRPQLAERATCIAALAVERQVDETEAQDYPNPARVRGAWFRYSETRMDDQQHALSALLRTVDIVESRAAVEGESDARSGESGETAPSAWLWMLALVAAFNPCRAALGVPRQDGSRRTAVGTAVLGGLIGSGVVLLLALASGPFLDAAEASDPAVRIATGVVAGVVGLAWLIRKPPSPDPALPGWQAALVPVAVPVVVAPALTLLAVGARADRGLGLVAAGLGLGVVGLTALVAAVPVDGIGRRVLVWGGRLSAALLSAAAVLLVVDGIFDV